MNSRFFIILSSLLLAGFTASGQAIFNFDIPENGWSNGAENGVDVSVSGTVDFTSLPSVSLSVFNDSPDLSSVTMVYMLKPMTSEGRRLNALSLDSTNPVTSDWDLANSLTTNLGSITGLSANASDYFGATLDPLGSIDGVHQNETLSFSFTLESLGDDETIDWTEYLESSIPQFVVRWQSAGDDEEGSAAGYGGFTPVPEPKQIAALSMLGLGGLLFIRRRLKARKTSKS